MVARWRNKDVPVYVSRANNRTVFISAERSQSEHHHFAAILLNALSTKHSQNRCAPLMRSSIDNGGVRGIAFVVAANGARYLLHQNHAGDWPADRRGFFSH